MIVIIGFIVLLVIVFRYHYFHIADEDCRKNTTDGVTYKDAFGHMRLLRNGRQVMYKKDSSGRIRMFYTNGCAVDVFENAKDAARFEGKPDYLCDVWGFDNRGYVHEVFATGERYLKVNLNGRLYYLDYDGKPLRIVREAETSPTNLEGVDIDEFNKISEEIYNQDPINKAHYDYSSQVELEYNKRRIYGKPDFDMQELSRSIEQVKKDIREGRLSRRITYDWKGRTK